MAQCENGHDVPEGQAFCGRCGGAAKGDDPQESEDDLAVESGPGSLTGEAAHSEEPEVVEAPAAGDFEEDLSHSPITVEGNVGEDDEDAQPGGRKGILGWVQAPEHGLIVVLGLVAIIVLIVVGVAVATSGGGDDENDVTVDVVTSPSTVELAPARICFDDLAGIVDEATVGGQPDMTYVVTQFGMEDDRTQFLIDTLQDFVSASIQRGQDTANSEGAASIFDWCEANAARFGY